VRDTHHESRVSIHEINDSQGNFMSQRIQILPPDVANKIAAGEVVERPASVVKELVENAIDAQCTKVHVEIRDGGKELIRVSDDGTGMDREDAILAFESHATSKIVTATDLEAINSLGFRGEALPSIAAVSLMELSTRDQGSPTGTSVEMAAGERRGVVEVGRPVGTAVTVKRLFYNTPARLKFLKSSQTERRRIVELISQLALAHEHVSFRLTQDGREILNLPATKELKDRLFYLWTKEVVEDLIFLAESSPHLKIEGCVGRPQTSRPNRKHQVFIVNRRPVVDRTLSHALYQGYQPIFPKDRHPASIMLLTLDPALVDVNVHPSKREVRFRDQQTVHDLVALSVSKALTAVGPLASLKEELSLPDRIRRKDRFREPPSSYRAGTPPRESPQEKLFPAEGQTSWAALSKATGGQGELISLWQLHNLYIFAAIKSGLVIIDQHAAHERVLYERAKKNFRESSTTTQQLLFPQVVELSQIELQMLDEHQDLLARVGFSVRTFGAKTVLVEAEPAILKSSGQGQVLREILDDLASNQPPELDREERLARSFACKGAIKAGDSLSQEEMNGLVNLLFATSAPYTCPHGRPTVIRTSLDELARKFGR
jgi:DNA mismatch repair protein MutL